MGIIQPLWPWALPIYLRKVIRRTRHKCKAKNNETRLNKIERVDERHENEMRV
jgi:hypothetical protein